MLPMYINAEQENTLFDLSDRVKFINEKKENDIIVEFDVMKLTQEQFNYITKLSEILANDEELEIGEFNLGIFQININRIKTYEEELIKCEY